MSGAWAKGANKAVSSAPPEGGFQTVGPSGRTAKSSLGAAARASTGNNRNRGGGANGGNSKQGNNNRNGRTHGGTNSYSNSDEGRGSGGGGRGGRGRVGGRGGRGRGRHHSNDHHHGNSGGGTSNNRRSNQASTASTNHQQEGRIERIIHKDVQLLKPGMGTTPAQMAVKRIDATDFILLRTKYMDADEGRFNPHEECHWTDDDREHVIQALCSKVMELGDVSRIPKNKPSETAPPIEECAPLEVNEETRWKSKAMIHQTSTLGDEIVEAPPETEEEVIAKALLILNKISWTTLDRLTVTFMEQTNLQENESMRHKVIDILIKKAQTEHHFGAMYAQLCAIISKQFKQFKKDLLAQCQKEFELDTAHKIDMATKGMTDPEEIDYHSTLIRKSYIGHIIFLGELYLRDVVKLSIMMYCLDELLRDDTDEESLECFAHLMTTMGEKLDTHAKQNGKPFDWEKIRQLRNSSKISSRIKFLLQDLLELKERGWVQRRKTEAAKSIADLHKELEKEEREAKSGRRASTPGQLGLRRASSLAAAATPSTDKEGFTQIRRGSIQKVGSTNVMPEKPKAQELRRATSQPVGMDYMTSASPSISRTMSNKASTAPSLPSIVSPPHEENLPSPSECADKMKKVLREYFVGGDTVDAVLSIQEMVKVGTDGSIDRGAKAVEGGVLMVMEMKDEDVKKFLTVMESCIKEEKIESAALLQGLNDPLEFLGDIEIDAPLAGGHLALIISNFLKWSVFDFEFLLAAPEYFRTEGNPAAFGIKILRKRGGVPSDGELEIIQKLMTDEDIAAHSTAARFFDAL
ncbi:MIF4G domain containing protein [Nitzschia inconspicua]|uniref:MIF4G domain containing protein n=1 Tax=Nitzschia inconspicua TaxID=303405 RepID=A0A9K3L4M9_9STRA|nr:MIF4G domain containing protein [Nitzschia inconspicua]